MLSMKQSPLISHGLVAVRKRPFTTKIHRVRNKPSDGPVCEATKPAATNGRPQAGSAGQLAPIGHRQADYNTNGLGTLGNEIVLGNEAKFKEILSESDPQPVIKQLLHLITNELEVRKLLAPATANSNSPAVTLQDAVNNLAFQMTPSQLAKSESNVSQVQEEFRVKASGLPENRKDELLTRPTSTAQHPQLVPLLYYAVASGDCQLVDFLLDQGADPNPKSAEDCAPTIMQQVPPLALAIAQQDYMMVQLLLQRGAQPITIPSRLYLQSMLDEGLHAVPSTDPIQEAAATAWCRADDDIVLLRGCLDPSMNSGLTMQYWLTRALKLPHLTPAFKRVALLNKLQRVPELRLGVIGQEIACTMLYNHITVHCGMSDCEEDERRPLVLLLAGPPGHGKTMLGQMMQRVLPGARYHFQDCSKMHHTISLWGAEGPFSNAERRSGLAECLDSASGQPVVVLLDEFEKMPVQVQNTLLSVLQDGTYLDAFSQREVDCTRAVFLLTTNAADRIILNYWNQNKEQILKVSLQPSALLHQLKPLLKQIRDAMAAASSQSLVSRLAGVVPFLPFTEPEQMLVVQQAMLDLAAGLAKPPNESKGRMHGSIFLKLRDQQMVCRALAKDAYCEEEGARALRKEVDNTVGMDIKTTWLEPKQLLVNGGTAELTAASEQAAVYNLTYGPDVDAKDSD